MFQNIMVGLDGSNHGDAAIEHGLTLAGRLKGRLHGVHVRDSSLLHGPFLHDLSSTLGLEPQLHLTGQIEKAMAARAKSLLQTFQERSALRGVAYRTSSPTGQVVEALAHLAELEDLVVIGKRGGATDLDPDSPLRGSTALQLMKACHTPMLFVEKPPKRFERIMIAYDGSPGARCVLKEATRFAHALNSTLILAHVVEPGLPEENPLLEAQRYLEPYGVEPELITGQGPRVKKLAELVVQEGIDLLCVGYQGASRLRELFVGHAPELLLDSVSCALWVSR